MFVFGIMCVEPSGLVIGERERLLVFCFVVMSLDPKLASQWSRKCKNIL